HKYFDGIVPAPGAFTEADEKMLAELRESIAALTDSIENFHFREALRQAMDIARLGNRYLQETEPWKTAKTDMDRTATVLYLAIQLCANLSIAFAPFLPFMSDKLVHMLGGDTISWAMLGCTDLVPAGARIKQPELLFDKIDDEAVQAQLKRLEDTKKANLEAAWKPAPQQADVDFDTFCRADLRIGTVLECERVPKADKLLRFLIDDGTGTPRTIVSGIAKSYPDPAALKGLQVVFIANLPPRKLRGIESQGMLLSAEDKDGRLVLASVSQPVAPGAQVK
ncbi:MAG: methionine--tRNA ligase subunit beta, partial [Muribaculaceae bacterium]|nr:methionine--tRNA ligase subunit beta [Muribaculaceae bacterium]